MPDEQRPTPQLSHWPSLIILPTLARFQLLRRRLREVVRLPSSLVELTLQY